MNTKEDIEKLILGATSGDSDAQNSLGCAYHNGDGVIRNYLEAYKWYKKAAEQSNMHAQYNIGILYRYGLGIEKNLSVAFEWYLKAAKQNHDGAEETIGIFYDFGYGVEKDYEKAFEWYLKAANNGRSTAQNNLGGCYKNGNGTKQNFKNAFYWFQMSAYQDNDYGMCNVGIMYEEGLGVKPNYRMAEYWYKKSAEKKHDRAIKRLDDLRKKYNSNVSKRIELDIIRNNPYRILGTYSNSPIKEITANKTKITAYERVDKQVTFNVDGVFSKFSNNSDNLMKNILRNEDSVSTAIAKISQPKDKLKYALFWFHNSSPIQDIGINHLINGNIQKAIEVFDKKHDPGGMLNCALCKLCENNDADAIEYYIALIHNEDSRNEFVKSVCGETYKVSECELMHLFLDTIMSEIPDFDIELVLRPYIYGESYINDENNKGFLSKCVYHHCDINHKDHEYVINKISSDLIAQLESEINTAKKVSQNDSVSNKTAGLELMEVSKKILPKICNILDEDDVRYATLADKLANQILQNGINFYNAGKNPELATKSLEIQSYALSIAVGKLTKERCQENVNILKKIIAELPPVSVLEETKKINEIINDFASKPNKIRYSLELVHKCAPILVQIKGKVGINYNSDFYVKLSTRIVDNALANIIDEVNSANDNTIKNIIKEAWNVIRHLDLFTIDTQYNKERYTKNRDTLKSIISNVYLFGKTYDDSFIDRILCNTVNSKLLYTEDELYGSCKTLKDYHYYVSKYPNGKYIVTVNNTILRIEEEIEEIKKKDKEHLDKCVKKEDYERYLKESHKYYLQEARDRITEFEQKEKKTRKALIWVVVILSITLFFLLIGIIWGVEGFKTFFIIVGFIVAFAIIGLFSKR